MKKSRVRISIALLLASTLVFIGITYYLVSNTYKLEKNIFHFKSTNLVSEIYFSTSIDLQQFDNHAEEYWKLLSIKNSNTDNNIEIDQLMLELQKAFIDFENIGERINTALLSQGIETEVKTAYSISRVEKKAGIETIKTKLDSNLRVNELVIFGDDSDLTNYSFYIFHHNNSETYYQSKLYISFPKMWNYMLWQMKELLLGILLVMIIIFSVFIYTIQTIRGQKKLAEIKNDFINNMTHELNTPISTIRIASQNLLKDKIKQNPAQVSELATTIIRQNRRLQKIVSNVMQASLNNSDLISVKLEEISLHNLLHEIIADFNSAHEHKNIQIEKDFKAQNDFGNLDLFYFSSVIYNLLDNAVKYSISPIRILVSTENRDEQFILKIHDHGIGIPAKDQTMIFDKFYRVTQGNIHQVKGLGLGLYIVKQILNAHQAKIKLISKVQNGSTFIIQIPIKKRNG